MSRDASSKGLRPAAGLLGADRVTTALRIAAVLAIAYGFASDVERVQQAFVLGVFYAAIATSYALVIGHTRVLSFAHAAIAGIGAYAYALISIRWGWSIPVSIAAAVAIAMVASGILAVLTLRFSGIQLGVLTISLAFAFDAWIKHYTDLTGGGTGLFGFASVVDITASSSQYYLVALMTYAVVVVCVYLYSRSRYGLEGLAVGDDELLAPAVLVSPFWARTRALVVGGGLAGFCGAMYAQTLFVINPETFGTVLLLDILVIVYLAGDRTIVGILVAALLTKTMPIGAGLGTDWLRVGFGVLVAAVLIIRPAGLYPRTVAQIDRSRWRRRITSPGDGMDVDLGHPATSLVVRDVAKTFGGVRAVDGVSFEVHGGQVVGIIGPNGSGKTTLLNCVSGFVTPTSGSVSVRRDDGEETDLTRAGALDRVQAGLGRSFQTPRVFDGLDVRDNLVVAGRSHGSSSEGDVEEVMGRWPLGDGSSRAANLTHAQRRWLELARLEFMDSRIMLLDEPAAGLGDEDRTLLADSIRRLRDAGKGVVFVEHDLGLVASVADVIIVMSEGRAIGVGDWKSLASDPEVADIVGDRLGAFAGGSTGGHSHSVG